MTPRGTRLREGLLGALAAVLLMLFLAADVGGARRVRSRRGDAPERRSAAHRLFELRSGGPDGRMGTTDDVVWPERPAK